jgi:hypothetical protein
LDYTCDVAETRSGDDVLALVRRGDLGGSSFAFSVVGDEGDEWEHDGGVLVRHLLSVQLRDVSPCGTPAYDSSTVSLRSLARQVSADLADVQSLASNNRLPTLFTRSDIDGGRPIHADNISLKEARPVTPWEARKRLTDMRYPQEPKTISGRWRCSKPLRYVGRSRPSRPGCGNS